VGFDEQGVGKGSGRSIEGFSLVQALTHCHEFLDKYGGHEMAAGLTVREQTFGSFVDTFRKFAREVLSDEQLQPCLRVDHELAFSELNFDFLHWHEMLQPFGNGNPQPLFCAREVQPTMAPKIVKEKHLILRLRQKNFYQRAVFFDGARLQMPPAPWDIAFQVKAGEYEGEARLELHVQAVREAEPAS
jgi:single-stranded-DNA-specific exonuclease